MTETYLCFVLLLLGGQDIVAMLRIKQLTKRVEWLEYGRRDHD